MKFVGFAPVALIPNRTIRSLGRTWESVAPSDLGVFFLGGRWPAIHDFSFGGLSIWISHLPFASLWVATANFTEIIS